MRLHGVTVEVVENHLLPSLDLTPTAEQKQAMDRFGKVISGAAPPKAAGGSAANHLLRLNS